MYFHFSQYTLDELEKDGIECNNKDIDDNIFGTTTYHNCLTCDREDNCIGHLGYYKLKYPIIHPLWITEVNNEYRKFSDDKELLPSQILKILKEKRSNYVNAIIYAIPILPITFRPTLYENNSIIYNNFTIEYNKLKSIVNKDIPEFIYVKKVYNLYNRILGLSDSKTRFLKQQLSGKNGIFRKYCMARRENYCVRSVISPNINIPIDTVLLPKIACDNFHNKDNNIKYKDNDMILLNRQPTLKYTNILAFKSIASDKSLTIQINPAIASNFGADFDGDEMNVFWKHNLDTINDMKNILSINKYKQLVSIIQNTLSGLYVMSKYNKKISIQLFYDCLDIRNYFENNIFNNNKLDKKINVFKYYCGKKLNAHLILSLCFNKNFNYNEDGIMIKNGIFRRGIITKFNIKKLQNNLDLNTIWLIQKIVQKYLSYNLLSLSLNDIREVKIISNISILNNLNEYKLNDVIDYLQNLIIKPELDLNKDNGLCNIINSGAKGTKENLVQMKLFVGQQIIINSIPNELSMEFINNKLGEEKPIGFCNNSYLKGLNVKELYHHAESSRIGIISTSLNTSRTGYLQRQLVKFMENTKLYNDNTIRNNNRIISFIDE